MMMLHIYNVFYETGNVMFRRVRVVAKSKY
jgi:hypothetical protein